MATQATAHCLTGCAIGEVLGMIIGTSAGLHDGATVALSVALAFFFGYALTMRGVLRAGLPFRQALRVALAADTLSILVMEVVDKAVVLAVPGAMDAGVDALLFWAALTGSLAVAFVVTLPVNRWLMSRGRGHAVVHSLHWACPEFRAHEAERQTTPVREDRGRASLPRHPTGVAGRWGSAVEELRAVREGQQLVPHCGAAGPRQGAVEGSPGTRRLTTLAPAGRNAAHLIAFHRRCSGVHP